jgi:hypothetical protein
MPWPCFTLGALKKKPSLVALRRLRIQSPSVLRADEDATRLRHLPQKERAQQLHASRCSFFLLHTARL